jgi:hypothetical protein
MNHPEDGLPASDGGDEYAPLPSRRGGMSHSIRLEARPELRDRETYYGELRYAVHCQSRSITPGTWAPHVPDTWT